MFRQKTGRTLRTRAITRVPKKTPLDGRAQGIGVHPDGAREASRYSRSPSTRPGSAHCLTISPNLGYLWFLGYDLDETPPDHSILSKARARYSREAYRQFFVVVTSGHRPESHQVGLLLGQHRWLTGTKPEELVVDRAYGTTRVYDFLRSQRILPSIPRRAPWRHKAAMKHKEFVYVPGLDRYRCPQGKWLYRQEVTPQGLGHYRTHQYACRGCGYKPQCTRAARCTITRPVDMDTRDWVDAHMATPRARRALRRRPSWAETVFADLKGNHGLERATLRGPAFKVQALLAAATHNIKRLAQVPPATEVAPRLPQPRNCVTHPRPTPAWSH